MICENCTKHFDSGKDWCPDCGRNLVLEPARSELAPVGVQRLVLPFPVAVAGYGKLLKCTALQSRCGQVHDGIAFEFGNDGGWVVSFSDLEKVIEAARLVRGREGQNGKLCHKPGGEAS